MDADSLPGDTARGLIDKRLEQLQELTGLSMVFGGLIEQKEKAPHLVITQMRGNLSGCLSGLVVPSGRGLGGLAIAAAQPFVVNDYRSNSNITHHFDDQTVVREQLVSVFAHPVTVNGKVAGVLYGATRDTPPIGDVALRLAGGIATKLEAEMRRLLAAHRPTAPRTPRALALEEIKNIAEHLPSPTLRARLTRAHRILAATSPAELPAGPAVALAPRERECLALAATGATNAQIAAQLGLGTETVKTYLHSAMRRLNAPNRTAAAHIARAAGLI
jgi:LuxR family transcriptional regulator, regulator of acetate metabolism